MSYLTEIILIFLVTTPLAILFQKLKQPIILSYLIAGILLGPSTFGVIQNREHIELLSEIGVILLLFSVGLEFSLAHVRELKRHFFIGGGLQILFNILGAFVVTRMSGWSSQEAWILGFLVSLSSTAIVFKLLYERAEVDSVQGRVAIGILLFQDLCVIPMMLILPGFVENVVVWKSLGLALLKAAIVVILLIGVMNYLLPKILDWVARLRNREIFIFSVALICFGTAWATQKIGLSLALGAFISGLLLAKSEYSHHITAEILPLRNLLSSLFFISIGMLLDVHFIKSHFPQVVTLMTLVMVGKSLVIALVVFLLVRSMRVSILVGLYLAQIGEFSFVLARVGKDLGVLSSISFQGFLATSILTMLVTPVLFRFAPDVSFWVQKLKGVPSEPPLEAEKAKKLKGHVIIAGFGLNGQNLAQVLTETHIPFIVIDLNPNTLQRAREKNFPAIYGDSSDLDILLKAGIKEAQVFVIAISDPVAARRVVGISKKMNQNLHVLVRTRYVAEIDALYRAGADQVIPEEFETSVEIFSRVLQEYRVPRNVIELQTELIRQNRYGMLRGLSLKGEILSKLPEILSQTTVETFLLLENSFGVGLTESELNLHGKTGVVLMAVVRNGKGISSKTFPQDFRFQVGDILILVGSHAQLDEARKYLSGTPEFN